MTRQTYRPEIDGLRALAVLSVVLYHVNHYVPGGYVGVDVFFVISGFLITSLIDWEITAGTFSLRNFWVRRVRRIMPAAAVTVVVCLVAGYFILLPTHFEELGRSAVAQALAAANVFFFREAGYFSTAAESKPLLHFWSLAVEEQFYLIFPLVLLALRKWGSALAFPGVALIAILSFALSLVGTDRFPDATFYLLPARAWELALGGLLAMRGCRLPLPEGSREMVGWIGMGLMVAPMFLYNSQTPFPGLTALPPCLGTVLVIWATAKEGGRLTRVLCLKPVVGVGLISYSLYLWHWPVLVYTHYWYVGYYTPVGLNSLALALSFALAWLSWRYIETPFRSKRKIISTRFIVTGAIASGVATVIVGCGISAMGGLPARFPAAVRLYDEAYADRPASEEADLTTEAAEAGKLTRLWDHSTPASSSSLLLWGDSHARVTSTAVEAMCGEFNVPGFRASRSATACLLDYGNAAARRYNNAVFHWIENRRPTWVVLVSRWEVILWDNQSEKLLRSTVERIQALGVKVAIMRQVASQRRDVPKTLAHAVLWQENPDQVGVLVEQNARYTQPSNEIIDRIVRTNPGLRVLDPIPYLSKNGRCIVQTAGHAFYYDNQHLTRYGARFLTPMFATLFEPADGMR